MKCEKCNGKLKVYKTKNIGNVVIRFKKCLFCGQRSKTTEQ